MELVAAACAVALTVALFKTIGPKRTRFVAQIVAAVIGAAFVIGLQIGAILSFGSLSRSGRLVSSTGCVAHAPDVGSIVYWPALAVLGDITALAGVLAASLLLLGLAIVAVLRRASATMRSPPPVSGGAVTRRRRWTASFRTARRRGAHCGRRSGRCSPAIPGWCRSR